MTNMRWDVVVVGAGPAGAMAAYEAARSGASTLLLDRQRLPRYKLCGGGLIGTSMSSLPAGFQMPATTSASSGLFSFDSGTAVRRTADAAFLHMVMRSDFDAELVRCAEGAGARVQDSTSVIGVNVSDVDGWDSEIQLRCDSSVIRARTVIGADGSTSRIAKFVGARFDQIDLGLEIEFALTDALKERWKDAVLLDFSSIPGAYGWIFPKPDRLTVGVIAGKGLAVQQREYLSALIAAHDLQGQLVVHEGGHLTRVRAQDSPVERAGVFLCGDAAGLLEPWTREGISFALRSGRLAGRTAAATANAQPTATYTSALHGLLGEEMRVGAMALRAYSKHPKLIAKALQRTGRGWGAFQHLSSGASTFGDLGQRRSVRAALRLLG